MAITLALLVAQLAVAERAVSPVLSFPQAGLDDAAKYQGYETRFYRDARQNTVQVYLDEREGRIVHVWADADNESIALSVRAPKGGTVPLEWGAARATVAASGRRRTLTWRAVANAPEITLGWFLLGSMRVERDFQYHQLHRRPFTEPAYRVPEVQRLVDALAQLPADVRPLHLAALNAGDLDALRARLTLGPPRIATGGGRWRASFVQPSLDARDTLQLEFSVDARSVAAARVGDSLVLRALRGRSIALDVRITTTTNPLNPLSRQEIFTPEFLRFLAVGHARGPQMQAAWMERQVRAVELLSSREKLMAGMPTYATYFGRDMMVTALVMRPIWRAEMAEFVIGAVLRKLSAAGAVSHEEALGGQIAREVAHEYVAQLDSARTALTRGEAAAQQRHLGRALDLVRGIRTVRENYHMMDDELQFPIVVARWIEDPRVSQARKRDFLAEREERGRTRAQQLLAALAVVADMTAPYAAQPSAERLISFTPRDATRWSAASWRDSGVGYANGRYAMDVNAIWAPHALRSLGVILQQLEVLGWDRAALTAAAPAGAAALRAWISDRNALQRAVAAWEGAARHFEVRLTAAEVGQAAARRLAALPANERAYWNNVAARTGTTQQPLEFSAIALDATGRPIRVAHTDVATRVFLDAPDVHDAARRRQLLNDVRLFTRHYPAGLLMDRVGPLVANDVYATPEVWDAFEKDRYHGPRVVWGREVHLFQAGIAAWIAAAQAAGARDPEVVRFADELRRAFTTIERSVEASGFRAELWSYEIANAAARAVRYGSSGDIQLWSTADLAVQYAKRQAARPRVGRREP